MPPQLRAGVARAVTTPPVGITHAHWGAQTHTRAEGVDLDLWATALVVSDGADRGRDRRRRRDRLPERPGRRRSARGSRELTGIPASHVRLSASHTHSAGNLSPAWYPDGGEMIPGYLAC